MESETFQPPVTTTSEPRQLSDEEKSKLSRQECISEFKRSKLESDLVKNWDKFYNRNQTNFFKDRHWTEREFRDLVPNFSWDSLKNGSESRIFLEAGCGVGNLLFPLLHDFQGFYAHGFDCSRKAIDFVKSDPRFDANKVNAFVFDLTDPDAQIEQFIDPNSVDIMTLVFVLSAIPPSKWEIALAHLKKVLKNGGKLLFRDYAISDHAMVRFGPRGSKIIDRWYARQDGSLSYFFERKEVWELFEKCGFKVESIEYVFRETSNVKEGIKVSRVFLQGLVTL